MRLAYGKTHLPHLPIDEYRALLPSSHLLAHPLLSLAFELLWSSWPSQQAVLALNTLVYMDTPSPYASTTPRKCSRLLSCVLPLTHAYTFKIELHPILCDHSPQVGAVVVGFDRYINYYKIQYATLCIRENPGCLFIATNRDAVTHLTDAQEWAGSVCAAGLMSFFFRVSVENTVTCLMTCLMSEAERAGKCNAF